MTMQNGLMIKRDFNGRFLKNTTSIRKGVRLSAETKEKISLGCKGRKGGYGMLGKSSWNKGIPCDEKTKLKIRLARLGKASPRKGIKLSEETREKMRKAHANIKFSKERLEHFKKNGIKSVQKQQASKQPTSIEKAVYDYLLLKGILFERQRLINDKFLVDAYIPSLNLIIEVDGNYWHSLPRVVKKDKAENAYLKKCGFKLVRLSEEEIKKGSFEKRLEVLNWTI